MSKSVRISKSKPQNITDILPNVFSDGSGEDGRDEALESSSNDDDLDIKAPEMQIEAIKPTLGIHSTLLDNEYDIHIEPPQEESQDLFDTTNIPNLWKKIHWQVWENRNEDPNLFFYYFPKFDEKLLTTPFNEEDEEILLITLIQLFISSSSIEKCKNRIKGKWGFISMKVPYRNGLLCYQHYLKLRLKRGEFRRDEAYLDFLKKKITNEELAEKIDDKEFLDFFMDLDPGYSKNPEQAEFWMREAKRMLNSEEAEPKIKMVQEYKNGIEIDNDYCFAPTKELQKSNYEALLVSISQHPYVRICHSSISKLSIRSVPKSTKASRSKGTPVTKKDESKSSVNSKSVIKKMKKLRVEDSASEGLITPDRVERSTDISNYQPEPPITIEQEEQHSTKMDTEEPKPEAMLPGKLYSNLKDEKKSTPSVRKMSEERKQDIKALVNKYKFNFRGKDDIDSYDSEPDNYRQNKDNRDEPLFFSDISSIYSNDEMAESEFAKDLSLFKSEKPTKDFANHYASTLNKPYQEATGEKRKAQKELREQMKEKRIKVSKRYFMEDENDLPKQRGRRKRKENSSKKKSRKAKTKKVKEVDNFKENEISKKKTVPEIKIHKAPSMNKNVFEQIEADITPPKVQSKLEDYFPAKEINKDKELKRINKVVNSELLVEEVNETLTSVQNFVEKNLVLPRFEISLEYIQDEDKVLENFYSALLPFNQQLKLYVNCITNLSLALFGKYDVGIIIQIRNAAQILTDLEKELHRVSKFATLKESNLRNSGEIGNRCIKLLHHIDELLVRLYNLEGSSLLFILAVAEGEYEGVGVGEMIVKENMAHLLKLHKNFTVFLRKFDSLLNKSQKAMKSFVEENVILYFATEFFIKKTLTIIQLPMLEEFVAVLLTFFDDKEAAFTRIYNEVMSKMQGFLRNVIAQHNENNSTSSSINESFLSINKKIKTHFSETLLILLKKRNEIYEDPNDNPFYSYLSILMIKYYLKIEFKLNDLIRDLTFLSSLIQNKFAEIYILSLANLKMMQLKVLQYISRPVPDLKTLMSDFIQDIIIEILTLSNEESQISHAIELAVLLAKTLPWKTPFFFKFYDALSKMLKNTSLNVKFHATPIEKCFQYDQITLSSYLKISGESENKDISHISKILSQHTVMAFPLIFDIVYSREKVPDEAEQAKLTRRIFSKLLSLIQTYGAFSEENIQDPRSLKMFLLDFSILLAAVKLTQQNPELLRSVYFKVTNFVSNLSNSHMLIKNLLLSIQIDIMNFCVLHPECHLVGKEIFEKVLNILSSLLNEFLEVSRFMNMMSKLDKAPTNDTNLEDKYLRLQKLIEQTMLKLRNAILNNIEFILENQVVLYPKGNLAFLKMLNPKNPVTCGLRKEILDYLELILLSRDKVYEILRSSKTQSKKPSPTSTLASQVNSNQMNVEEDIDFMTQMLEKAKKNDAIANNLLLWRQVGIDNGKEILMAIHELLMSIYNKEIMTKIHPKFHLDIFLVEKSLELYALYSKVLVIEGKMNFEEIDQKIGFNSLFYTSKSTRGTFSYSNDDRLKGILISKNNKLGLLLRFYSRFFSFEKTENAKLISRGTITGLENFVVSAHLVLFLASMESLSDITAVQQSFYNFMADFALMIATQDIKFSSTGFKEFLLYAYIERGYPTKEDVRDSISVLRRICYNLQLALEEAEMEERSLVLKFVESLLIKLVRFLRQDLFEESQSNNNGKFFNGVYKHICGIVSQLGSLFAQTNLNKPLIDMISFILIDNIGKINYNIADDFLNSYDPIIIKCIMRENIPIDFKFLIDAIFSIVHKDKHFPRKVFVKFIIFLLRGDLERLLKLKNENEFKKSKKWELLFRKEIELNLHTETFFQNLINYCAKHNHHETLLNCVRELINYTMLSGNEIDLVLPLLKSLYSILKSLDLQNWLERFVDIFIKLLYLLDATVYSDEERIAILHIFLLIIKRGEIKPDDEKYIEANLKLKGICTKWIIEIMTKFDNNILDKLQAEGYEIGEIQIKVKSPEKNEINEINEMQVKIFELALRVYNWFESAMGANIKLAQILKELLQEKIKINLTLGESKISGETKKILQILNEF